MPNIETKHARLIASKLEAREKAGAKHDLQIIEVEGKEIARFGIQRGSKQQNHNYVPGQLFIDKQFALGLANCPKSLEDWIVLMREKGRIDAPSDHS